MDNKLPSLDQECFFIAPIGSDGSEERKRSDAVLEFVVGRAAEDLQLVAVRGDQIAEPGQINLQVIDHILGARAAVADLTGLNPNVFYELAVRHTARLPVVLIAERETKLPFDIAQMRTIFLDSKDLRSADTCRREIVGHLGEALTKGAVDSPIATSIDVKALQAGDAMARSIAELVTTVEELTSMQRAVAVETSEVRILLRRNLANADVHEVWEEVTFRIGQLERLLGPQADPKVRQALRRLAEPVYAMSGYKKDGRLATARARLAAIDEREKLARASAASVPPPNPEAPDPPIE